MHNIKSPITAAIVTFGACCALSCGFALAQQPPANPDQDQSDPQYQERLQQQQKEQQKSQDQQQQQDVTPAPATPKEIEARESTSPANTEVSKDDLAVSDQELQTHVSDINKATKLIGMRVKNRQNENLGEVKDLVVDFKSGRIAYAVLSVGGFLGIGDKLIAVPLQSFAAQPGEKTLLLDMSKQMAQQAAGFGANNWPDLNQAQAGRTIGLAQGPKTGRDRDESRGGAFSAGERGEGSSEQTQVITDLNQLTDPNATGLEGKRVQLSGVRVREKISENVIAVSGPDQANTNAVYIKTQRATQDLKPGQTVSVEGKLHKGPADAAGLDEQTAEKLKNQKLYIEANQVKPTQP